MSLSAPPGPYQFSKPDANQPVLGAQLCEQGGGPGLSFPIPSVLSLSLISPMVSVDIKHHVCGREAPCLWM